MALGIHLIVIFVATYFFKQNEVSVSGFNGDLNTKNAIEIKFTEAAKTQSNIKSRSLAKKVNLPMPFTSGSEGGSKSNQADNISNGNTQSNFAATILYFQEPIYPKLAIKRNLEGEVKLSLKISASGAPLEIQIIKSSGHALLDQASLEAANDWRFQKRLGSEHYTVEKTIVFKLKN
jgi:TonB family protein